MGGPVPLEKTKTYINACIYGDPGSGKSILACTSPNALILDADPGLEGAAKLGLKVDVWRVTDYNDLTEAFEYVRHEKHDYEWVWLDSGTIFQERALHDHIMADLIAEKPHREEFVPDMREYMINQNHLSKLIRHFVGMPINFGLTAYAEAYDIGENQKVFMPMFQGGQGSYSTKICGYMNLVGYLGVVKSEGDEFKNRLVTRRAGRYYAKDRFGVLPATVDNPNMEDVQDTIQSAN